MTAEKKPRARRRGGRARGQKAGGMLANLHGRNIVVEDEAPPKKKSSRPAKTKTEPMADDKVVDIPVKSPPHVDKVPVKPQELLKDSKLTQVDQNKTDVSPKPCAKPKDLNATVTPPRPDKENNDSNYKSPGPAVAEQSPVLSPVETAAPTPPLTSVKMRGNDRNLLLSPLSPMTTFCDAPDASDEDESGGSDDVCSDTHSEEMEEGSDTCPSQESKAMSAIAMSDDEESDQSSENSRSDAEASDVYDDSCDQGYGYINEEGEETDEDEDFSIEAERSCDSDSDDEFEFDEESGKKPKPKGRKKVPDEEERSVDSCDEEDGENDSNQSIEEDDAERSNVENDTHKSTDEHDDEMCTHSLDEGEESQASSSRNLNECKKKLNDFLGDEENHVIDTTNNDEMISENKEGASIEEESDSDGNSQIQWDEGQEPHEPEQTYQSPEKSPAPNNIMTETSSLTPVKPSTSELYAVVDDLFRKADQDTVTVKDIVRSVANHFNLPKVEKPMKKAIKARLTDLIQGNVEVEAGGKKKNSDHDAHESAHEPSSDDEVEDSSNNDGIGNESSMHHSVVEEFTDTNDDQCEEADADESTELPQSTADISFGESVANASCFSDDSVHDDGRDEDAESNNVSVEKAKYVLCPMLESNATSDGEQKMPPSPLASEASLLQKVTQQSVPTESNVQTVAKQCSSPTRVPSIAEEGMDDDSVTSGALFQNLSPDFSVKSKPPSGKRSDLSNLMDSMSMSNSFGNSMKSRNMVEKGKWSLGSEIGAGSFGRVYTGMNAITGNFMAVKMLQIPSDNKHTIVEDLQREIDLMKTLKHPNIVRYLGAEVDNSKNILYIFQEWAQGGSISSILKKFGLFSINVMKSYVTQILKGLDYLHSHGVLHRDIKGGNILVSSDGAVKLADFGASKRVEAFGIESDEMELTMRGTPYFMAPEVFEGKYGSRADIWSVGGVIYQMATGSPPWKDLGFKSPIALFMHLKNHDSPPKLPQLKQYNCHEYSLLESILSRCFQREPSMRPSALALMSDSFLNNKLIAPSPKSPNLSIQISPKDHPASPCGADFLLSPRPTFASPLNKIPEYEAINTTLSDSLCYSLTLKSPLPKVNSREKNDVSEWPDWAKKCNKENATHGTANKSANKGVNPYAKKLPFARTNLNIR